MNPGDWISYMDSPTTRGIVVGGLLVDDAEENDLYVFVHGETEPRLIWASEIDEWWETWYVAGDETRIPFWVKEGELFKRRGPLPLVSDVAKIFATRPGWVAYLQSPPLPKPVFMIERWDQFHDQWRPLNPPTSWNRLMEDDGS